MLAFCLIIPRLCIMKIIDAGNKNRTSLMFKNRGRMLACHKRLEGSNTASEKDTGIYALIGTHLVRLRKIQ
jgi:hypothetical protein